MDKETSDQKMVREWLEQVKCLTDVGMEENKAKSVIAVFAQADWLLIKTDEYPEEKKSKTKFLAIILIVNCISLLGVSYVNVKQREQIARQFHTIEILRDVLIPTGK